MPLAPVVDLGDYKRISVEKPSVEITDEMVSDTILELQRQHAILEPVERPAQYNDKLRIDVRAEAGGEEVMKQEGAEFSLREEMTVAVPGLAELLPGLTKGPEHELAVDVPDDYGDPEVAREDRHLLRHDPRDPERNPARTSTTTSPPRWASTRPSTNCATRCAPICWKQPNSAPPYDFQEAVLAAAIKKASVEAPPFMVEHEIDHMLGEMAQQSGQDPESYMRNLGPAAVQIRESLRERAAERVLRSAVLSEAT